jgi:hypothetical protein
MLRGENEASERFSSTPIIDDDPGDRLVIRAADPHTDSMIRPNDHRIQIVSIGQILHQRHDQANKTADLK